MLISRRFSGDGALDRTNVVHSMFANSSCIEGVSRLVLTAFGFSLNLMHPQSIFAVLPTTNALIELPIKAWEDKMHGQQLN